MFNSTVQNFDKYNSTSDTIAILLLAPKYSHLENPMDGAW